jgi:hypothetical protein
MGISALPAIPITPNVATQIVKKSCLLRLAVTIFLDLSERI